MIGNNLIFLRKRNNLKQSEMLTLFGVQNFTWSDYEREKSTPPVDLLFEISDYFQIDIKDLVKTDLSKASFSENEVVEKTEQKGKVKGKVSGKVLDDEGQKEALDASVVNLFPKVVTVDSRGNENMVLIQSKARAGYLNGYGDPEYINTLPAYRLPGYNNGNFRMFEVAGLSMHPTLNDGDILITRSVESLTAIRNDHIHVVVTNDDGIVVKRVLNRIERDNKLILKSDNIKDRHEYPNMVVEPSQILEIWYVIGFISRIMKSPTEMYERMIEVEGRLTLMDHKLKKAGL